FHGTIDEVAVSNRALSASEIQAIYNEGLQGHPRPSGAQTLTYSLENAPAGASIDPVTGVFTWTPTEAQGPGSYTFTVRATDNGSPPLSDARTVTVTVNEVNVAPVLAPISDRTVNENDTLTFTASATDADIPANTLTYSLDPGYPAGATINASTGAFT